MRSPFFRSAFGSSAGWRAVALASLLVAALGLSARAQSQEPKPKIAPPAATAAATPPAKTGVHGNAYTSPTFGYTLSWDPAVWTVKAERLVEGYDGLELGTDRSNVFLEGMNDYNGDVAACLADARKQIASRQGIGPISDFQGPGGLNYLAGSFGLAGAGSNHPVDQKGCPSRDQKRDEQDSRNSLVHCCVPLRKIVTGA